MQPVLVTGGAGFIGRVLLERGYKVVAANFGAFRPVISGLSDHPFRFKPITDSAILRSLLASLRNQ